MAASLLWVRVGLNLEGGQLAKFTVDQIGVLLLLVLMGMFQDFCFFPLIFWRANSKKYQFFGDGNLINHVV